MELNEFIKTRLAPISTYSSQESKLSISYFNPKRIKEFPGNSILKKLVESNHPIVENIRYLVNYSTISDPKYTWEMGENIDKETKSHSDTMFDERFPASIMFDKGKYTFPFSFNKFAEKFSNGIMLKTRGFICRGIGNSLIFEYDSSDSKIAKAIKEIIPNEVTPQNCRDIPTNKALEIGDKLIERALDEKWKFPKRDYGENYFIYFNTSKFTKSSGGKDILPETVKLSNHPLDNSQAPSYCQFSGKDAIIKVGMKLNEIPD